MATIIISILVFAAIAAAAWYSVKTHRAGKCVGCSGCDGHCDHCSEEIKEKIHKV
jgi:hypothetical protein